MGSGPVGETNRQSKGTRADRSVIRSKLFKQARGLNDLILPHWIPSPGAQPTQPQLAKFVLLCFHVGLVYKTPLNVDTMYKLWIKNVLNLNVKIPNGIYRLSTSYLKNLNSYFSERFKNFPERTETCLVVEYLTYCIPQVNLSKT